MPTGPGPVDIRQFRQGSDPEMWLPFHLRCDRPLLVTEFAQPQRMLSWAMTRPGFRTSRNVAWLEVRNLDLSRDVDPFVFLEDRMALAGLADAIALMTSRDVRRHHLAQARAGDVVATCLATVGLSNALRVGMPSGASPSGPGTINLMVHVSQALSEAAFVETISIATQARTAALLALDHRPDGAAITGTGTDCIVVAAPLSGSEAPYAGLHTPIGEAVGRSVEAAILDGGRTWLRERGAGDPSSPSGDWKVPA